MSRSHQVIHIHPEAPPKPSLGQPCNGCGVCCLAEPCPVGMLLSRRVRGACVALRWSDAERRYLCGLLAAPVTAQAERWWARPWARLRAAWVRRIIAAGSGCDASLEAHRG